MTHEKEKDYKPIKTLAELDTMLESWGGLIPIIDPAVVRSGDVGDQKDALNHNNFVLPLLIELAKNELVDLEAEYNNKYLIEFEKLTDEVCQSMNMTAVQKKNYVERRLHESSDLSNAPDSIGAKIKKYKNKIVKIEEVAKAQINLLWTYNKPVGY